MLLLSDFMAFEVEREIAYRDNVSLQMVSKPVDGSIRFVVRNKRRGRNSHFATLEEAVKAFNEAQTGA